MNSGLEGIVAAQTMLSDVDGANGRLIIRGVSLDDLVASSRYEDVAALLLDGLLDLPANLPRAIGEARLRAHARLSDPGDLGPVEALRAMLARLPDGDATTTALDLMAGASVYTAALLRRRTGQAPLRPDPDLSLATDTLRMMTGTMPTPQQVAALDRYLVTVCDHGLNASTFAARVVASTQAGLASATLAGLSALKGPLHGGAPGPVLDMLDAVSTTQNADDWIADALARGERLMGFGHRIYRVRDPRADALKGAVNLLAASGAIDHTRLALAEAVETSALRQLRLKKPDRPLETNVEFYTALLLESLGFPRDAFTCVFAMGRTTGWIAHAREQVLTGRLIRPASIYVGPMPKEAA
jgi:citrate synthase